MGWPVGWSQALNLRSGQLEPVLIYIRMPSWHIVKYRHCFSLLGLWTTTIIKEVPSSWTLIDSWTIIVPSVHIVIFLFSYLGLIVLIILNKGYNVWRSLCDFFNSCGSLTLYWFSKCCSHTPVVFSFFLYHFLSIAEEVEITCIFYYQTVKITLERKPHAYF